jgi:predicted nuclease of predicted toxin-antitoxin system
VCGVAQDDQVLDRAIRTGAIILTCDRDFGQWVRQMSRAAAIGVFVF